jgi:O-antigen/teichoic acid export membrane protein
MFSHYFSGSGKPWHNTISSGIGLIFTVSLGFILIPMLGITGAGLTSSIAYSAGMIYQLIVFKYMTQVGLREFIPGPEDFRRIRTLLKEIINRS